MFGAGTGHLRATIEVTMLPRHRGTRHVSMYLLCAAGHAEEPFRWRIAPGGHEDEGAIGRDGQRATRVASSYRSDQRNRLAKWSEAGCGTPRRSSSHAGTSALLLVNAR